MKRLTTPFEDGEPELKYFDYGSSTTLPQSAGGLLNDIYAGIFQGDGPSDRAGLHMWVHSVVFKGYYYYTGAAEQEAGVSQLSIVRDKQRVLESVPVYNDMGLTEPNGIWARENLINYQQQPQTMQRFEVLWEDYQNWTPQMYNPTLDLHGDMARAIHFTIPINERVDFKEYLGISRPRTNSLYAIGCTTLFYAQLALIGTYRVYFYDV